MPVPASRSRRARQPDSDVEDNTQQNQDDLMDADGEDEDAPANRRVNAKANGRASAGKNGAPAPEDDDDQDQDEAVDVENYPDQPLGHEQFIHINGVANDWKGVEANLRGLTATLFNDIATGLIDSDSAEIDKVHAGCTDAKLRAS